MNAGFGRWVDRCQIAHPQVLKWNSVRIWLAHPHKIVGFDRYVAVREHIFDTAIGYQFAHASVRHDSLFSCRDKARDEAGNGSQFNRVRDEQGQVTDREITGPNRWNEGQQREPDGDVSRGGGDAVNRLLKDGVSNSSAASNFHVAVEAGQRSLFSSG